MPNDVLEDPDCTQSVIFKKSGMFTAEILGTINYYLRYTAMNDYVHVRERERVCVCVCVCACVHVCVCDNVCSCHMVITYDSSLPCYLFFSISNIKFNHYL